MGRVVAIAGGDLLSTRKLNVHAITLSNKTTPNVLFIGTASHDAEGYIDAITKEYNQLNCEVKSLCLVSGDQKNIDALLSWADIIYVGGGDTIFMMQIWKQYKLDENLGKIFKRAAGNDRDPFYSNWNWIFIPVSWIFRRKYHYCIHFRGSDHCNHYGQQRMERMLFAAQCVVV